MPDIGGIPTYPSTLTGQELDEALRNIGQVQDAVEQSKSAAQTAEKYGQIVEQNQDAIQSIEDNLDVIQQAPQNAQTAQKAATDAAGAASAAAQSAADAEDAAERAEAAAGIDPDDYYKKAQTNSIVPWQYTALYQLDNWAESDEDSKSKGYVYQQTVPLTADDARAPTCTEDSKFLPQIGTPKTGVPETDAVLQTALNSIYTGMTTVGAGTVTTLVREKPASDIPVVWMLRTEVTT